MTAYNRSPLLTLLLALAAAFTFLWGQPFPRPALASSQPLVMETEDERLVRWDLTADHVTTLHGSEIMEAKGNVYLRRGSEYLKADFARYYMSTKWVYLKGNVIVRTGRDEIRAEEAEFDLRSRVGWLKKGRIFMDGPHAYLSGERIDKHWGDVYTFKQAKVTTCDGDSPAWSLTADEAVVEIDGYARLRRSTFQVKDTPVAFSPFFVFPTKTSRQTGLLRPEFGRSSSKGLYFNQPFFWAINESSDLTVNEYFMEKRGFMHGAEYRARPTSDSTVWLRGDWMYDKKRELTDTGDYGGDGFIRNNYERYWLRGMIDARLPDPNWRFKADFDYVSDQNYLSEFKDGFSGFTRSRDELFALFSRDLQEKDRHRVSGFLLTREWDRFSVALSSTYSQNQYLGNGNNTLSSDDTVQRLPQVDAYLHKGRLFSALPLEVEASAQAAYMYRRSGTRGARYEVVPKLTLPVNTRYGSIIASAGLYQTFYETESASRSDSPRDGDQRQTGEYRTLPEFNVAGFTEFAKVYSLSSAPLTAAMENVGNTRWMGLRHSIQPRVEFRHRVNEDQDRNPSYSPDDRLAPRTELVYSITNVLVGKREQVVMRKNTDGEMSPTTETSFHDLIRLRLEQSYDQREATRSDDKDIYPRRPYSDVFMELSARITDQIYFSTKNDWSPYLNDITRHQSGISFNFPEYGSVYVGYDIRMALDEYKREQSQDIEHLRLDLRTARYGPWSLYTSLRHDFEESGNREAHIDLEYNHQCVTFIGRLSIEPQEESFNFFIMLNGLGD